MIKKPYSIIFICVLLIIGCTNNNSVVQKQITHIRFFDNSINVQINEKLYHLKSKDKKTIQQFKEFYDSYHYKVSKQALNLQILTQSSNELIYSLFIDKNLLSDDDLIKLKKVYQAEAYEKQYIKVTFLADAKTFYGSNNLTDEYKLDTPLPIVVTDKRPFFETGNGQLLFILTMPVWVPFALVFGLKP